MSASPLLLFDGICNLCNGTVRFILARDKRGIFRFAALQSDPGRAQLRRLGLEASQLKTLILIEGGRHSERSTASLRILLNLGWPYKALYAFILIPKPLRDLVYDLVARNRYRLFGKREACMMPTPELKARFLT
jgi:predicted DCC family thiol-disulfide oxidoreductase YuxK